ncbi:MAG: hypothetical protein ABI162_17715 [Luteolibacter sp.]
MSAKLITPSPFPQSLSGSGGQALGLAAIFPSDGIQAGMILKIRYFRRATLIFLQSYPENDAEKVAAPNG